MSNAQHKCPANGCGVLCERHILFCKKHWYMVSSSLRKQVLTSWAKYERYPDDNEAAKAYMRVRSEVIDYVNKQLVA